MSVSENNFPVTGTGDSAQLDRQWARKVEFETPAAEARLSNGKNLVIIGSIICIVGIVIYCMSLVSGDFGQQESVFIKAGLAVIGTGFVCWLTGAIKYLNAAIDANSSEELF